jgi:hypothetical protein
MMARATFAWCLFFRRLKLEQAHRLWKMQTLGLAGVLGHFWLEVLAEYEFVQC